jgi:hypothetical protein
LEVGFGLKSSKDCLTRDSNGRTEASSSLMPVLDGGAKTAMNVRMNIERHGARRAGDGKGRRKALMFRRVSAMLKLEFRSQDFQRGAKNLFFLFKDSPWDLSMSPVRMTAVVGQRPAPDGILVIRHRVCKRVSQKDARCSNVLRFGGLDGWLGAKVKIMAAAGLLTSFASRRAGVATS